MAASTSPAQGTRRGRHQRPSTFAPRALLGPLGSRADWQHPDDPYDLGQRQPANLGAVLVPPPATAPTATIATPTRPALAVRLLERLVDLVALGVGIVALLAAARSGPMSAAEAARAVRVVAAARPDVGPLPGGWPQHAFEALAAGWVSLTGALHREPGAAQVVREPTVLASGVLVALVWVLASRLRLALPVRVTLVLGCALTPVGAALLATARPGVLAALPVLLAAVLITGERVPAARQVVALLLLALALAWVPALAVALAATFAVLVGQGDLGRRLPRPARRTATLLLALAAATVLALYAGDAHGFLRLPAGLRTGPAIPAPHPSPAEWVAGAVLLAGAALALRQRWLRAPAVAVGALLATAVPVPDARGDLLAVALPLLLLVGLACGEELLVGAVRRRRLRRRRTFGPHRRARGRRGATADGPVSARTGWAGWVALGVAIIVLAVAGAVRWHSPLRTPDAPPTAAVGAWFAHEVEGAPAIGADDALWPGLIAAGLPAERLRSPSSTAAGAFPGAAGWLVTTTAPGAQWVAYARFDGVWVLRRGSVGDQGAAVARTNDGVALAANRDVRLALAARAALTAGRVDARLLAVLATFAGGHTLDIADFPAAAGAAGTDPALVPLRGVLLTAVDGNPVGDATEAALVSHWFDQQLGPYHPCAVGPAGDALLVRYCLPA
jgi:hypothetical protein